MQYLIYVAQGSRVLTSITRKRKDMAREAAQRLAAKYAAYQNRLLPGTVTNHAAILDQIEKWAGAEVPCEALIPVGLLMLRICTTCPPDLETKVRANG